MHASEWQRHIAKKQAQEVAEYDWMAGKTIEQVDVYAESVKLTFTDRHARRVPQGVALNA